MAADHPVTFTIQEKVALVLSQPRAELNFFMASQGPNLTEQLAAQTAATLVIDEVHGDVRAAPSASGKRWWSEMSALRLSAAALQSALYTPLSCGASDLPVDPDLPLLTPDTADTQNQ